MWAGYKCLSMSSNEGPGQKVKTKKSFLQHVYVVKFWQMWTIVSEINNVLKHIIYSEVNEKGFQNSPDVTLLRTSFPFPFQRNGWRRPISCCVTSIFGYRIIALWLYIKYTMYIKATIYMHKHGYFDNSPIHLCLYIIHTRFPLQSAKKDTSKSNTVTYIPYASSYT